MLSGIPVLDELLQTLAALPPGLIYLAVGAGATVENIFPPVPADTFVLFGAFLAAQGRSTAFGVFLATWIGNVSSALVVYGLGRRWGAGFFGTRVGHWLLRPRQLERLGALYEAHGSKIIFVSRFLPGFRAVVPVFAGVSRLGLFRTAAPLGLASGLWYGVLVYVGVVFGRNWGRLLAALQHVNAWLLAVAAVLAGVVLLLWWRTRRHAQIEGDEGEG